MINFIYVQVALMIMSLKSQIAINFKLHEHVCMVSFTTFGMSADHLARH